MKDIGLFFSILGIILCSYMIFVSKSTFNIIFYSVLLSINIISFLRIYKTKN